MRMRPTICFVISFSLLTAALQTAHAKAPETKVIISDLYTQSGATSKLYDLKPDDGWHILPGTSSIMLVTSSGKPSYGMIKDDGAILTYRVNTMVNLHGFIPASSSISFKIKVIEYR